jgi:hypothetical protein
VNDELRRDQQTDGRKPNAVRVRQTRCNSADRGEVPAGGDADTDTADRGAFRQWCARSSTTTGISRSVFVWYSS